jgi:hypothetical protein
MKKRKSLKRYDVTDKGQNHLIYEAEYNEDEKPLVEIEYSQGGVPISTNTYEYDEDGNLISESLQGEEKEAFQRLDYVYSDDKKKMTKTLTYADGSTEKEEVEVNDNKKTIRKYDEEGELTEETVETFGEDEQVEMIEHYNAQMDSREKHVYTYDDNKKMAKEEVYIDGELYMTTEWERDEKGRVLNEEAYDEDGDLIHKHYYKYEGDLLMEEGIEEYRSYNSKLRFHFDYDEQGRLVQQIQETYTGELVQEIGYELNEQGDVEMAHFVRTGLYHMIYGQSAASYNQSLRNEIEYYD